MEIVESISKTDQVKSALKEKIFQMQPQERLPSETECSRKFNVSRFTVSSAFAELEAENLIYRKQGRGTFVAPSPVVQNIPIRPAEKTKTIVLLLHEMEYITDAYFSAIAKGIGETLEKNGYHIQLRSISTDKRENNNNNMQGVIITDQAISDSDIVSIAKKVPVVLIDREVSHPNISSVSMDNYSGLFDATEYLINLGHENIIFFVEELASFNFKTQQMVKGFQDASKKHGLKNFKLAELCSTDAKYCISRIMALIKEFSPSAFLFTNDKYACTILKILKNIGYSVPSQISVMGYNDEPISYFVNPPLSTVKIFLDELGKEAAKTLICLIEERKKERKIFQPRLLIRESTTLAQKGFEAGKKCGAMSSDKGTNHP